MNAPVPRAAGFVNEGAAVPPIGGSGGNQKRCPYQPDSYQVVEINEAAGAIEYHRLLDETYSPLGFMSKAVLPAEASERFQISYEGQIVAIFRLTEVTDPQSEYFRIVPGAVAAGVNRRLLEVNNVIVAREFRASILLPLLMYRCALTAHERGFDYIVGITRHQTLKFFVDFGVVPVDHEPLHILGRDDLLDFVMYYETGAAASIAYMHERARRYFHQLFILRSIDEKYVRRTRKERIAGPQQKFVANGIGNPPCSR